MVREPPLPLGYGAQASRATNMYLSAELYVLVHHLVHAISPTIFEDEDENDAATGSYGYFLFEPLEA